MEHFNELDECLLPKKGVEDPTSDYDGINSSLIRNDSYEECEFYKVSDRMGVFKDVHCTKIFKLLGLTVIKMALDVLAFPNITKNRLSKSVSLRLGALGLFQKCYEIGKPVSGPNKFFHVAALYVQ